MKKSKPSSREKEWSVSKATSYEELADFWNTHSVADFQDQMREVHFDVELESCHHYVGVDAKLMDRVTQEAHARGISSESLVNLILQEALMK